MSATPQDLQDAMYKRDERAICVLLDKGKIDIKQQGGDLLVFAASHKLDVLASCLITSKVDVNYEDARGRTPLKEAACSGAYTIVMQLIAKGVDVNRIAKDGRGVIHEVVRSHLPWSDRIIRALVAAKANINLPDGTSTGSAPLVYVIDHIFKPIQILNRLKFLVELGADIYQIDKTGQTLLDCDLNWMHSDRSSLQFLLNGSDVQQKMNPKKETTAFYRAVDHGMLNLMQMLVSNTKDVKILAESASLAMASLGKCGNDDYRPFGAPYSCYDFADKEHQLNCETYVQLVALLMRYGASDDSVHNAFDRLQQDIKTRRLALSNDRHDQRSAAIFDKHKEHKEHKEHVEATLIFSRPNPGNILRGRDSARVLLLEFVSNMLSTTLENASSSQIDWHEGDIALSKAHTPKALTLSGRQDVTVVVPPVSPAPKAAIPVESRILSFMKNLNGDNPKQKDTAKERKVAPAKKA